MGEFHSFILLLFLPLADATCPTTLPTDAAFALATQYHAGTYGNASSTHLLSLSNPASSTYSPAYNLASGSFMKTPSDQCSQSCLNRLRAMGKPARDGTMGSIIMLWDSAGQSPPGTNILYSAYTTTVVPGEYLYCSNVAGTCGASVPLYLYYNAETDDYQVRGDKDTVDDSGARLQNMGLPICWLFPTMPTTSTSIGTITNNTHSRHTRDINQSNSISLEDVKEKGNPIRSSVAFLKSSTSSHTPDGNITSDQVLKNPFADNLNGTDRYARPTVPHKLDNFPDRFTRSSVSLMKSLDNSTDRLPQPTRLPIRQSDNGTDHRPTVLPNVYVSRGAGASSGAVSKESQGGSAEGTPPLHGDGGSREGTGNETVTKATGNGRLASILKGGGQDMMASLAGKFGIDAVKSRLGKLTNPGNDTTNGFDREAVKQSIIAAAGGVDLPGNVSIGSLLQHHRERDENTTDTEKGSMIQKALNTLGIDVPSNFSATDLIGKGRKKDGLVESLKSLGIDIPANFSFTDLLGKGDDKKKILESLGVDIPGNFTDIVSKGKEKLLAGLGVESTGNHSVDDILEKNLAGRGDFLRVLSLALEETGNRSEITGVRPTRPHQHHSTTPPSGVADELVLNGTRRPGGARSSGRPETRSSHIANHYTTHPDLVVSIDYEHDHHAFLQSAGNETVVAVERILERLNTSLDQIHPKFVEVNGSSPVLLAHIPLPSKLSEQEVEMLRNETASISGLRVFEDHLTVAGGEDTNDRGTRRPDGARSTGGGRNDDEKHETRAPNVTVTGSGGTTASSETKISQTTSNGTRRTSGSSGADGTITNGIGSNVTMKPVARSTGILLMTASAREMKESNVGDSRTTITTSKIIQNESNQTTVKANQSIKDQKGSSTMTTSSGSSTTTSSGSSSSTSPVSSTSTASGSSSTTTTNHVEMASSSTTVSSSGSSTTTPSVTATGSTTTTTGVSETVSKTTTTPYTGAPTTSTTADRAASTTTTSPVAVSSSTINGSVSTTTTSKPTTTTSPYVYEATTDISGTYEPGDQKLENGTVIRPNGDTIYPNGTVRTADGTIIEGGKKIDPDGTVHNPDGSTKYANGTVIYPGDSTTGGGGKSDDDAPTWVIPVIIVSAMLIGVGAMGMIFFGVMSMMKGAPRSVVNPYDVPNANEQWPNQRQPTPSADLPPPVSEPVTTAQPQSFGATQTLQGAAPNSLYFG